MVPSLLTVPPAYGSVMLATCVPDFNAVTRDSTSAFWDADVNVRPVGASNTTLAVAPSADACGNSFASRSIARWDWVPGMPEDSDELADTPAAPIPTAASMAIHSIRTSRRRRKENRPRR